MRYAVPAFGDSYLLSRVNEQSYPRRGVGFRYTAGRTLRGVTLVGFRQCAWVIVAAISAACAAREPVVEFYLADGYRFSQPERRAIEAVAESTAIEARRVLPSLPPGLAVRVYAGRDVIPETGETGAAIPPATVIWVVNPGREGGVLAVVDTWLRASLLHEFHHLARLQTVESSSLMDEVVTEGLATAFERDVAGVVPPWGTYPDTAREWVSELISLPPTADRGLWLRASHPDNRRWIGMRAGTYLADQAIAKSGKSAAELVSASTEEVLELATSGVQQ